MSAREPLTLEQVAAVLSVPRGLLARDKQRQALGLVVLKEPPEWCLDRRVAFFDPASVEAAAARVQQSNERLSRARKGLLPASWAGFKPSAKLPHQSGEREAEAPQAALQ